MMGPPLEVREESPSEALVVRSGSASSTLICARSCFTSISQSTLPCSASTADRRWMRLSASDKASSRARTRPVSAAWRRSAISHAASRTPMRLLSNALAWSVRVLASAAPRREASSSEETTPDFSCTAFNCSSTAERAARLSVLCFSFAASAACRSVCARSSAPARSSANPLACSTADRASRTTVAATDSRYSWSERRAARSPSSAVSAATEVFSELLRCFSESSIRSWAAAASSRRARSSVRRSWLIRSAWSTSRSASSARRSAWSRSSLTSSTSAWVSATRCSASCTRSSERCMSSSCISCMSAMRFTAFSKLPTASSLSRLAAVRRRKMPSRSSSLSSDRRRSSSRSCSTSMACSRFSLNRSWFISSTWATSLSSDSLNCCTSSMRCADPPEDSLRPNLSSSPPMSISIARPPSPRAEEASCRAPARGGERRAFCSGGGIRPRAEEDDADDPRRAASVRDSR
mmetsp:Transcript_21100/g.47609  ORF Transcript_21100/g.47609 Transcript_21100/m.47609 type:complete len:465 (+) Transcript_21100:322-1716(+)